MRTLSLRDGRLLPALGLGTWLSKPDAVRQAVRRAIEVGYRHIDCAWIYQNEAEVGAGINEAIRAGDVRREELWVTTKLWNDAHAPEAVRPALERSLKLLGLDYVDLYLVHWPVAHKAGVTRPQSPDEFISLNDLPLSKTWSAMVSLPESGLAQHVGVSNFSLSKIDAITDAVGAAPDVNQIEMHPFNAQADVVAGLKERGIVATAYSPLGSSGRPPGMKNEGELDLLGSGAVATIAAAHDASPAQVLIAWALERGTSVIPKSTNADRIAQNFAADKLQLSDEDIASIAALDQGARYVSGDFWCPPGSPYTVEELWA